MFNAQHRDQKWDCVGEGNQIEMRKRDEDEFGRKKSTIPFGFYPFGLLRGFKVGKIITKVRWRGPRGEVTLMCVYPMAWYRGSLISIKSL